ncbi:hypothetical protein BDP81DRAFT_346465 [Colletotrichum phormii]|uniref:Zn(2)-C6 fungal-type domain-containing protein n=1 Tax=Colletotrichum phormii TaxID=359342 RepID=A0AAI9ZXU4_9PEZI|nr:uncharacterized protein BDP81DRAFT_346465 [Colletotrichum phormii]KAK1638522.1 hypothetical protein BDP81DRAFT_346465 [Colletotrichum phormii]
MSQETNIRYSKRPPKVRQACDPCHSRKIRCDGCWPCTNCQEAILEDDSFRPSPLVSTDIIEWCLDAFFRHKYPLTPILHRQQVEECIRDLSTSPEKYGLMTACSAVISLSPEILQPPDPSSQMPPDLSAPILPTPEFLISETLRARRQCNLAEHQSLLHAQTSFFLFSAFFCMDNDNAAWFYLRESITILQTLRLHEEATYNDITDQVLATYARHMFWVLFITERAYALQRHRPLTLQSTLGLPIVDPLSSDAAILPGFLDLISLFRHFDTDFIATWNSSTPSAASSSEATDPEHLSKLQTVLKYAIPSVSKYSEMQQADLLISRQWLKVIVWKLCVSKTLLSTTDSEDSMSLSYPTAVARDVVLISRLLPTKAFEANGVGILEKVFDVGCSLADLISLGSATNQWSAMHVGPVDILMEIVRIVGTTLGGSYKHLDMLYSKASYCLLMNVDRNMTLVDVTNECRVEEIPE